MMPKIISLLIYCYIFLPVLQAQADPEFGIASYYNDAFHGRKTASGELYNKNKFTAAHNTLPFGTLIRVTRLDNNRSVKVKINDRGPYIEGRIVDLSREAAQAIGMIREGQVKVKIEVVGKEKMVKEEKVVKEEKQEEVKVGLPEEVKKRLAQPEKEASPTEKKEPAEKPAGLLPNAPGADRSAPPAENPQSRFARVTNENFQTYDLYKIQLMRPKKEGFGVQVAYLTDYRNVLRQIADLQGKWFDNVLLSVEQGPNLQPVYKIILGPFTDRKTAESYADSLRSKHKIKGFVVSLSDIEYGKG